MVVSYGIETVNYIETIDQRLNMQMDIMRGFKMVNYIVKIEPRLNMQTELSNIISKNYTE